MGKLIYGHSDIRVDIEDRALAHLQIVMGMKLRRRESFFFSWKEDPAGGGGRSAIWMDSSIPLYFKFSGGRMPAINRDWVAALLTAANSGTGLTFVSEPNAPVPSPPIRGYV